MHRLLPPSAIAGVSLVCALGPWVFTEPMVLRGLAAAAAATAVVGAIVLRRWDTQAGKRVADLTRARASDEWRFEERVAELEADLEESRELRAKLEQRLRAKRTELAGLRNEHAALLRRYATAETERASVLEERRVLEIEATAPVRAALPAGAAETAETPADADEAAAAEAQGLAAEEQTAIPAVFSPEGSRLFRRAAAALARLDADADAAPDPDGGGGGDGVPKGDDAEPARDDRKDDQREQSREETQGQSEAAAGHERATARTATAAEAERLPQPQPASSGHYTVPTAVAVAPQTPVRRHVSEDGFDFFGTKQGTSRAALEAVQNEDLADVVGQEALAVHKAETEARFKPADEESRGIGQVIDLTAHDETEQIDVQGLRSAVS
ncbi:secreted protein [Streptomyces azureus]|uniref:Secreted protein n=1 Tax=Streptomyces azureus TaxID=146537 RepID=A0A0K8PDH6_STRAJ|nr:secreted protein [Streptomyces azureus]